MLPTIKPVSFLDAVNTDNYHDTSEKLTYCQVSTMFSYGRIHSAETARGPIS